MYKINKYIHINMCISSIDYAHIYVYNVITRSSKTTTNKIKSGGNDTMKSYRVYINGILIAVESFTTKEVRKLNRCEEIRLIENK